MTVPLQKSQCEECNEGPIVLRVRRCYDNAVRYGYQCMCCYAKSGPYLTRRQIIEFDLLGDWVVDAWDEPSWERKCAERAARRKVDNDRWHAKHQERIDSEDWKRRVRPAIFERERGKCQGCGAAATQVHHASYAHLGEEFFFELMALCEACHERLSKGNGT